MRGRLSQWRASWSSVPSRNRPAESPGLLWPSAAGLLGAIKGDWEGHVLSRWHTCGIAWVSWHHQGVSAWWGIAPCYRVSAHISQFGWERGRGKLSFCKKISKFPCVGLCPCFFRCMQRSVSAGDTKTWVHCWGLHLKRPAPGCRVLPAGAILPKCLLTLWISWWEASTVQYKNYIMNMVGCLVLAVGKECLQSQYPR